MLGHCQIKVFTVTMCSYNVAKLTDLPLENIKMNKRIFCLLAALLLVLPSVASPSSACDHLDPDTGDPYPVYLDGYVEPQPGKPGYSGDFRCSHCNGIVEPGGAIYVEEFYDCMDPPTDKPDPRISNPPAQYGDNNPPDTDPDNPDNPDKPDNPDNPVNPNNPDNPSDPVTPGQNNPQDPPTNADTPANPENPEYPGNPENPVNPADSETPVQTDPPAKQDNPKTPENQTTPEQTNPEKQESNPETPEQPVIPAQQETNAQQTIPEEPVQPATPSQPEQQEQENEPIQSEVSVQSAVSAQQEQQEQKNEPAQSETPIQFADSIQQEQQNWKNEPIQPELPVQCTDSAQPDVSADPATSEQPIVLQQKDIPENTEIPADIIATPPPVPGENDAAEPAVTVSPGGQQTRRSHGKKTDKPFSKQYPYRKVKMTPQKNIRAKAAGILIWPTVQTPFQQMLQNN